MDYKQLICSLDAQKMSAFQFYYLGVPCYQYDQDMYYYQSQRKWMVGEIFLIYLIFVVLKFIYGREKADDAKDQQKQIELARFKQIESRFLIYFAQHIILQSPCIMYGPRAAGVVIIYFHFIFFGLLVLGYKKQNEKLINVAYGLSCAADLINLLIGLGQLGTIKLNTATNLAKLK